MGISREGWDIGTFDEIDWVPWGSGDNARAKVLGAADGFHIVLIEAEPGYKGDPHEHGHPELVYVVDGTLRNQGKEMVKGDGYAAAAGSKHADFEAGASGATYLWVSKI